jgi:hypothetical protein
MKYDLEKGVNMKVILSIFEQISELMVIFHKSEIFFEKAKDEKNAYKKSLNMSLDPCLLTIL